MCRTVSTEPTLFAILIPILIPMATVSNLVSISVPVIIIIIGFILRWPNTSASKFNNQWSYSTRELEASRSKYCSFTVVTELWWNLTNFHYNFA